MRGISSAKSAIVGLTASKACPRLVATQEPDSAPISLVCGNAPVCDSNLAAAASKVSLRRPLRSMIRA